MKPKEYFKKYENKFDLAGVMNDFTADFMALMDYHKTTQWNYTVFCNIHKQMQEKFQSINFRLKDLQFCYLQAWEEDVLEHWREKEFGAYLREEEAKRKRKAQRRYEFEHQWDRMAQESAADFMRKYFQALFQGRQAQIPHEDFQTLQLDPTGATVDTITSAYRKLSLTAHPDKGGTHEGFIKLSEAKNRCLQYLDAK